MKYYIDKTIHTDYVENSIEIETISKYDFQNQYQNLPHALEIIRNRMIQYCKVIPYTSCIIGDVAIRNCNTTTLNKHTFSFYLTKEKIFFIEDSNFIDVNIQNMKDKYSAVSATTGHFLHDLLYFLILDDALYLQSLEDTLTDIEEHLIDKDSSIYHEQLLEIRKKLMLLYSYYHQLDDFISILADNETNFFNDKDCRAFKIQLQRVERIYDHIFSLKEYSLQVKEVYQAQVDARQNTIMKVLTVATSIFFPLSIITGWYGMNFKNMPELYVQNGYWIIMGISILIVIVELIILKWKKYL